MTDPRTLDDLREELAATEALYDACQYIDDWQGVLACRARCQREIDRIRQEIAMRNEGWSGVWDA